ncbi:MAG: hypothetical protein JWR83_3088 [Aeromicrobium sp.]|nr:hypothetical protein [Aeromicrobium sp.]
MTSIVRQRFEERASELADCASLTVESDGYAEWVRIVPHNDRALGVLLYRSLAHGDSYDEISHSHPGAIPLEQPTEASDVDYKIDLAVGGRLRVYVITPDSAVTEELRDGEYKIIGRYGLPAIFRLPGWRRRAQRLTFEPYRTPGVA